MKNRSVYVSANFYQTSTDLLQLLKIHSTGLVMNVTHRYTSCQQTIKLLMSQPLKTEEKYNNLSNYLPVYIITEMSTLLIIQIYLITKQKQNRQQWTFSWYSLIPCTSKISKPAEKDDITMTVKNLLDELMFIMQTRAIEIDDIPLWIKATD